MSRVLVLLFALIQADLPVQISAAGLRNVRGSTYYSPAAGYATESPAGSEEEEEAAEDDGETNSKEQVLQLVQAASAQAPDAKQKEAFLAWLAAGRKAPPVVAAIEAQTMRPSRSRVAVGYPALQQASSVYDFARREEPVKGDAAKGSAKGTADEAVEDPLAKDVGSKATVAEDDGAKADAKGGSDADTTSVNATADLEGGDNTCSPACAEGRGLCSDKVCFCRSPYTGMTCEKYREVGSVRFSYQIVAVFLVFAMVVGSLLGIQTFKWFYAAGKEPDAPVESASNTKERWRPMANGGS